MSGDDTSARSRRVGGHYFGEEPAVPSDPVVVDVSLPDTTFALETDRGVFSRGHLDVGTGLLLRTALPIASSGHLLDLGSGAGPIALTMARRSPGATVWAIDVNRRALDLTRRNAERNRLRNVRAVLPDEVPDDVTFSTVWSNPPIRIGKEPLHDLLDQWLGRVALGGTAALVVQRHLGADSLQRWLVERGWRVERAASKAGFRVLAVRRA